MTVPPSVPLRRSRRAATVLLAGLVLLAGASPAAADQGLTGDAALVGTSGASTASIALDGTAPSGTEPARSATARARAATARAARTHGRRSAKLVPRARTARATVRGQRVVLRWSRPRGARVTVIQTKDRTRGQERWRRAAKPVRGTKKTLTGLRPGHAYRIRLVHRSAVRGGRSGRPGRSILVRIPRRAVPPAPVPAPVPPPQVRAPASVGGLRIATSGDQGVRLSWNPAPGATGYRVERIDAVSGGVEHLSGLVSGTVREDVPPPYLAGRWLRYRVVAINASGAAAPSPPVEARAAGFPTYERFYALGDSYAAGTGIGQPYDDQQCARSNDMWAALIDRSIVPQPRLIACSGAVTQDVRLSSTDGVPQHPDLPGTQLDEVQRDLATHAGAALITISIGGNDAGFVPQFTRCVLTSCLSDAETVTALIQGEVRERLDRTFAQIREVAPHADVVIAGYPLLFTEALLVTDPSLATVDQAERRLANVWAGQLNDEIAASARAHGLHAVTAEVEDAFLDHGAGAAVPWINGVVPIDPGTPPGVPPVLPATMSIHPNRAGNAGYAEAVEGALREYASRVRLRTE
jgi:lysophospholipase L1-like esterase